MRDRIKWLIHNCVAHPIIGVLGAIWRVPEWAQRFHDATAPTEATDE